MTKLAWDEMPIRKEGRLVSKRRRRYPCGRIEEREAFPLRLGWLVEGKVELGDGVAQKADQAAR